MTDDKFELTRRKALAGLGAIGAAGAGAGLGTSALFSDEESFENNSIQAGELDLVVDYVTTVTQDGVSTGSTTNDGTIQGGESGEYQIADAKPGDSGFLAFCPKIVDNDGWLFVGSAEGITDYENGQTEPEEDADSSGGGNLDNGTNDGQGEGELSEAIQVDVEYCDPNTSDPGGPDDYDTIREFNNPDDYTLADLFKELESGFLLDGDANFANGTTEYPSSPDQNTQNGPCLCISWEIPVEVGNEIQSDAVEFDITFAARQWRNNATPENPFADATVVPGGSIQSAINGASTGDTISVHGGVGGGVSVSGQVVIDKSLTLARAGAARPSIDGAGSSPAISIDADGVTVDGFDITNPNELLGIKVQDGHNDVTICNNRIHDVGPTGNLGVSGIIVGQGNHSNIRIVGNVIKDLFQEDDGTFATLNGVLFDADNDNPGTLTDITVARNTIRALESTTAPLGIVVQHNVDTLQVQNNQISGLTADNSLGAGSFTTFAQGLSIDSEATTGFDIFGNTIRDVESVDGFFAEDIKIEPTADVSGVSISGNNLLSAIGLNNANGSNPTVAAENNYWGSSGGPLEIENNEDDGDVPTGSGQVDLDTVTESAVTKNVDYEPVATSQL